MRFYDPSTNPPTRLDSREKFPDMNHRAGARACLELGFLPSVTQVLKVIREENIEQWMMKEAIREFLKNGNQLEEAVQTVSTRESPQAQFGTACHALVEHRFGGPLPEVTDEVKAHTEPLLRWLDENVRETLFSELVLADRDLGTAGAIDLGFIHKDGRRFIGDIKVVKYSKKYPPRPNLNYCCQISAYAKMAANHTGEAFHRMNLYLASPFGFDKEPCLTVFEHEKCYLHAFQAARTLWELQVRDG